MATFNPNGRKKQPEPYPNFFTPPAGREITGRFVDPQYGAGTVTRSAGQPPPAIGTTPYTPPSAVPPGTTPYVEPPDDGSNIIEADFAQETDAEDLGLPGSDGDMQGPPAPNDWEAAHTARMGEVADQIARMEAIGAHAEAVMNGQPPPVNAPAEPSIQPPASAPQPKSAFTPGAGFSREPITFGGPNAWAPGDEVGFNDAEVQRQNPTWGGSKSWTPGASTMDGPYPSAGTPVSKRQPAPSTVNYYERAAMRGDRRRVNQFNARMAR